MTISSTSTSTAQASNGVVTDFVANFKILEDDHIIVYHVVGSTATLKALTTDYTVPTVGTPTTTVKFNSAPATGTVYMFLATAFTQLKRYVNSDKFPASSHEEALDKLTLLLQQTRDRTNRWALSQYQHSLSAAFSDNTGIVGPGPTGFSAPITAGRVYRVRVFGHGRVLNTGNSYTLRLNTSDAAGVVAGKAQLIRNDGAVSGKIVYEMFGGNEAGFVQAPTVGTVECWFDLEAIIRCTTSGTLSTVFAAIGTGATAYLSVGTTFIVEELPGCSDIPALTP